MLRPGLLEVVLLLASPLLLQVKAQAQERSDYPELDRYCQAQYPGKRAWCKREYEGRCMKCGTCEGKGEKYFDPNLGEEICYWNAAFLVDARARKGGCCPPAGHVYFFDEKSGRGSCCPAASVGFDGDMCVDPPTPKPPSEKPSPCPGNCGGCGGSGGGGPCNNCGQVLNTDNDNNWAKPTMNNNCAERLCPDPNGDTLGLEYGSCYRLKNPEGQALARRHTGKDYVWGGYYGDVYQFRICKSTTDCSKVGELAVTDTFVINDQLGTTGDSSGKLFWMISGALWHFATSDDAASAVRFSARPWCGDTCGICLRGDVKGLGPICPAANPGIGFKANSRYCQPLIVEKVPCINEDGTLEKPKPNKPAAGHQEL
ncbi:hypothetical protein AFLA70_60g003830 [Aspergillus flavus AF70]|nr:hypothetical protein AFLA70_60g003830 [Aspergillus flavus AF70]